MCRENIICINIELFILVLYLLDTVLTIFSTNKRQKGERRVDN